MQPERRLGSKALQEEERTEVKGLRGKELYMVLEVRRHPNKTIGLHMTQQCFNHDVHDEPS